MPNHITNIITLHGEQNDIDRVLEAVKYDDIGIGSLDFEKVIPMPPELNIERGSRSDAALKLYNAFEAESAKLSLASILTSMPEADHNRLVMELCQKYEGDNKELFTLGLQMKKNIQKHGVADWYEWSINNWNTKWNSYGYDDSSEYIPGSNTITFLTAWSAPHALMDKLSVKYPSIAFEHKWADENFGHNTGWRTLQNARCSTATHPQTAQGMHTKWRRQ